MKYKVVDLYDGRDFLGYAEDMRGVKKLAKKQYEDTDGECSIFYYPFIEGIGKYDFSKRKFLETV